jgi:hypothetical protein
LSLGKPGLFVLRFCNISLIRSVLFQILKPSTMKYSKLLVLFIVATVPHSLSAQINRVAFTLGLDYFDQSDRYNWFMVDQANEYEESSFNFGLPSAVLEWQANESWNHKLETLPFSYELLKNEEYSIDGTLIYQGANLQSFNNFFRYNITRYGKIRDEGMLSYFFGFGGVLRSGLELYTPLISNSFSGSETVLSIGPSIIAGLEFSLGEKWFLNVYVPFEPLEFNYYRVHLSNPNLAMHQQTTKSLQLDLLNSWSARIGFGVKL